MSLLHSQPVFSSCSFRPSLSVYPIIVLASSSKLAVIISTTVAIPLALLALFLLVNYRRQRKKATHMEMKLEIQIQQNERQENQYFSNQQRSPTESGGDIGSPQGHPRSLSKRLSTVSLRTANRLLLSPDPEWDIPANHLTVQEEIGRGAFGVVYRGQVIGIEGTLGVSTVAIKLQQG